MSVTKKRDLHTDTPLWSATPRISARSHKLPRRLSYDVIIIGAGISGALMADALADGIRSILVIDRRKPVNGSSLANTALIQHEIDIPLLKLGRMIGDSAAQRAWSRSMKAVQRLIARVEKNGIDCGLERKKTLFLAGDDTGGRGLREEAALRNHAGFDAQFLDKGELAEKFGIDRTGAVLSNCSASANPAQMTAGFLRATMQKGTELVSDLEVTDVATRGGEVILSTAAGVTLGCGHAIFCTGYEFLKELSSPQHTTSSSWALATYPDATRPDWLDNVLVWEASDPYLYLRTTPDGRIVAGGEDEADPEAHLDKKKLKTKMKTIAGKVSTLLGADIGEIEYAWGGAFGLTPTGLPIIDEVPGMRNVLAVMGYGGNGLTFSQIASELIAAHINGQQDQDCDLFRYNGHVSPRQAA